MDEFTANLGQLLRQADTSELLRLVTEHLGELDPRAALQVLRNPFAGPEVVNLIVTERPLLKSYELRKELVKHPKTNEVQALRLIDGLLWMDLASLGADIRVRPVLRRAADLRLAARLPGLAVGEKMAIARRAGTGLITQLRHDPSPQVIGALLENPRLTEGHLQPLVASERARPQILALIARDRRWGSRLQLRVAICRNPQTPVATALSLLPAIGKRELAAVAQDSRLHGEVRKRAKLLLGRGA